MQPTAAISTTGPAAFGVIAERFRRAGQPEKAVSLCREGLEKFPDHLSARVTLGWSLLDMGEHQEAFDQLKSVLKRAPDNLAAIRGLAELHERGIGLVFDALPEHSDLDPVAPAAIDPPVIEPPVIAAPQTEELDPVRPPMEIPAPPAFARIAAEELEEFSDLDPIVEPEMPMYEAPPTAQRFEIEDVIAAGESDSMFDLAGLLDPEPVATLEPVAAPEPAAEPEPVITRQPIPLFGGTPLALRDEMANERPGELGEWLSRIRQRRSESVSQLLAG